MNLWTTQYRIAILPYSLHCTASFHRRIGRRDSAKDDQPSFQQILVINNVDVYEKRNRWIFRSNNKVYELTQHIGSNYFKIYSNFSKIQRIEWNNRAISTIHAIFITSMSLYMVFCSNLFSDYQSTELITERSSSLSTFALGVSVGYFIADLGTILWFFPALGGYEYEPSWRWLWSGFNLTSY